MVAAERGAGGTDWAPLMRRLERRRGRRDLTQSDSRDGSSARAPGSHRPWRAVAAARQEPGRRQGPSHSRTTVRTSASRWPADPGQVQLVVASVGGAASSLDEAAFGELAANLTTRFGQHRCLRQLLLTQFGAGGRHAQDADVRGRKSRAHMPAEFEERWCVRLLPR